MRYFIFATIFSLNLLVNIGHGQVKVLGTFTLGDQAQSHLMVLRDSSKLVGRCLGIMMDSVTFEELGKIRKFSTHDIAYLTTAGYANGVTKLDTVEEARFITSVFIYMGKTKKGGVFHGKFVKMRGDYLSLEDKKGQKQVYPMDELKSFWLVGDDISVFKDESLYLNLLVTKNKELLKGQIVRYDGENLHYRLLDDSMMVVPMAQVHEIVFLDQAKQQNPIRSYSIDTSTVSSQANYNSSLFFTPTAFTDKKNTLYYQNTMLYLNSFSWYASSNISINAFLCPILVSASVKFIVPIGVNANFGVGTRLISNSLMDNGRVMPFGMLTFGNKKSFVSMSYQVVNVGQENTESRKPIGLVTLGGSLRLKNKLSCYADFIHSNSFEMLEIYNTKSFWTAGMAYYGKKYRINLGVFQIRNAFAEDDYSGVPLTLPMVSFTFKGKLFDKD